MARNKKGETTVSPQRVSVVGIGASAGGIEALREFFGAVPADLGLAYVVIVHLAPDHSSELASIIGRRTKMPVAEVNARQMELKPDHVYVISPDQQLEISDTSIGATPFAEPRGRRTAIDVFSARSRKVTAMVSRSSCPEAAPMGRSAPRL
jgi:two-component system CheB/CheR fusion protein